jgi:hypothetical protein
MDTTNAGFQSYELAGETITAATHTGPFPQKRCHPEVVGLRAGHRDHPHVPPDHHRPEEPRPLLLSPQTRPDRPGAAVADPLGRYAKGLGIEQSPTVVTIVAGRLRAAATLSSYRQLEILC